MDQRHRAIAPLLALALLLGMLGALPAGAAPHTAYDTTIVSHDGTRLAATVFRPAGASAAAPVPMILHSHGWGGSRTTDLAAFEAELDRGFGVLSFDQRGFGETGGRAGVQNPDREGRDVIAIVDYVAGLDWVAKNTTGNGANAAPDPTDPVLFAMGLSYGGGFQFIGALTELRDTGRTRFDALAPEITWFDLADSLAPARVARSAWIALLYAAGLQAHEDDIHVATAYGTATGQWPDGTVPGVPDIQTRFRRNSPVAFVEQGHRLDIPVLIGQGASDNLFNLNQGVSNFTRTLTGRARSHSLLVGYNGGHALPNALPPGYPEALHVGTNDDPCAEAVGGFGALRLDFFESILAGHNPRALLGGAPYHLATADGACLHLESLEADTTLTAAAAPGLPSTTVTTTGAGVPQHLELAAGPVTVAGIPVLEADVTTVGADQRVFLGLSVGETPATARVVQNNLLPLRELLPAVGAHREIVLPGLAVEVPEGHNLYLTVSPVSDMYFGHGSTRTPGAVILENIQVRVPLVG